MLKALDADNNPLTVEYDRLGNVVMEADSELTGRLQKSTLWYTINQDTEPHGYSDSGPAGRVLQRGYSLGTPLGAVSGAVNIGNVTEKKRGYSQAADGCVPVSGGDVFWPVYPVHRAEFRVETGGSGRRGRRQYG
jgi:hypothetical protein